MRRPKEGRGDSSRGGQDYIPLFFGTNKSCSQLCLSHVCLDGSSFFARALRVVDVNRYQNRNQNVHLSIYIYASNLSLSESLYSMALSPLAFQPRPTVSIWLRGVVCAALGGNQG